MRRIREQSKTWIKEFEQRYKACLPLLIEAYTNFYGEDSRDVITEKLTNTPFLFLLSYNAYRSTENIPKEEFSDALIRYFKYTEHVLRTMKRHGASDTILRSRDIRLSSIVPYLWGSIEYSSIENIIMDGTLGMVWFAHNNENPVVVLPVYFLNDRTIFHELDHLFITPDEQDNLFPNDVIEELINELIARDIRKIYRKVLKGPQIISDLKIPEVYSENTLLIKEFYQRFKFLIIETIKKQDIKILEDNLGKKNLHTYFSLVKKLFNKRLITDEDLKLLDFLIRLMTIHYENKQKEYKRIRDI